MSDNQAQSSIDAPSEALATPIADSVETSKTEDGTQAKSEKAADVPAITPSDVQTESPDAPSSPVQDRNTVAENPTRDGNLIKDGDNVLLMGTDGKKLLVTVEAGKGRGTHYGEIKLGELIGQPWGHAIYTMKGKPFYVVKPSLEDFIMGLKRATQIIYPKDIGPILLKLGVFNGSKVVECGCGSGALTMCLAWAAGSKGHVYAYDKSETHQKRCRINLEKMGLDTGVTFRESNILEDGFADKDADVVFLDLKDADLAVPKAAEALSPGGRLGVLVPTMNQVSDVIQQLNWGPFIDIEVQETLYRTYKTNAQRMRPNDRMIGHTGYLIFARRVEPIKDFRPKVSSPATESVKSSETTPSEAPAAPVESATPEATESNDS